MSEYNAYSIFRLEVEKRRIEKQIREYVGIVPSALYDRLYEIELKLMGKPWIKRELSES